VVQLVGQTIRDLGKKGRDIFLYSIRGESSNKGIKGGCKKIKKNFEGGEG